MENKLPPNNTPKISVVMPFYNAENFLDAAVQSILGQTFSDFEFIIINDNSTDKSDEVIQKYLTDVRIIYIKNLERKGISQNLNTGIRMARAEIIARMDGDDISAPNRLEKQLRILNDNPGLSIVGSFADVIDENDRKIDYISFAVEPEMVKQQCLYRGPFLHPTVVFTKKAFLELGGYRADYDVCEDIDFFLRMLLSGHEGMNIDESLLKYRKHSASTDSRKYEKASTGLSIKREMIREYRLKVDIHTLALIYADYLLSFFPRKLKKIFVKFAKYFLRIDNV